MKSPHWKTLAELVGIAALVASLYFVGYQLKQDRQFAEVLARANAGADLSDAEAIVIRNLVRHASDHASLLQAQSAARRGRMTCPQL